ncbi:tyrosine-type recombinase/integrase [Desulfurobacterium crinifex]
MNLKELFEKWKLNAPLSLSMKTVKSYERRLQGFISEYGDYYPEELRKEHLGEFIRKLTSESVREQTAAALTNFRKFLSDLDIPFPEVPSYARPKGRQKLPNPISEEVFWKMMKLAEEEEKEFPYRKAVLILLGLAGLRIQEALQLLPSDIVKEGSKVKVIVREGKGRKDRIVPIAGEYGNWLWERKDRLFPLNLHENSIRKFLKNYGKKCGDPDVYPHRLRHFFATQLTAKGVPVQVIQKLLGHSSPATTMVYSKVVDSIMEEAVEKLIG